MKKELKSGEVPHLPPMKAMKKYFLFFPYFYIIFTFRDTLQVNSGDEASTQN
jgi:uncharacterized protein YbgA (DUF1722 family)